MVSAIIKSPERTSLLQRWTLLHPHRWIAEHSLKRKRPSFEATLKFSRIGNVASGGL
jgi:hypothetical protein